jgi:hypothetical protein
MFVRLAFAVQTVIRPDVFIVDEALSVGDYPFQRKSVRHLEDYIASGGTVLITTHDTGLVQRLCTRAIVLHNGRLVVDDEPTVASQQYITRFSEAAVHQNDPSVRYPSVPVRAPRGGPSLEDFSAGAIPRPPKSDFLSKDVEILAVRVENAAGTPCLSFRTGDVMRVRTLFRVNLGKPFVSNGLTLTDPAGTVVWGAGSVNQRKTLPVSLGKQYISTVEVTMNLGPGRYDLTVGLATPSLENNARTGEFHDRFVNLATIEVRQFELGSDEPVPFWGLARLPYRIPPLVELEP